MPAHLIPEQRGPRRAPPTVRRADLWPPAARTVHRAKVARSLALLSLMTRPPRSTAELQAELVLVRDDLARHKQAWSARRAELVERARALEALLLTDEDWSGARTEPIRTAS